MTTPRQRAAQGLQVGDSFTVQRVFTQQDVEQFAQITGDYNPIHFDADFARERNMPQPICHGLLSAAMVTEIGGQVGWLASSMHFKFKAPVYPDETVTCRMTILSVDERGRAMAHATITNPQGVIVIEAQVGGVLPSEPQRQVMQAMLDQGDPTNLRAHDVIWSHDPKNLG